MAEYIAVKRWGDPDPEYVPVTPVVECGQASAHRPAGCVLIGIQLADVYRLIHLTRDDARQLGELLNAATENAEEKEETNA